MTFKPQTIDFKSDIGIFHMLPGNPFRANLIRTFISDLGLPTDRGMGAAFIIVEGYTYGFTALGNSDLATYFTERKGSLEERFELFGWVDTDRIDNIFDAFSASRDNPHKAAPQNDEEKEAKKNGTSAPSGKPLIANVAKES